MAFAASPTVAASGFTCSPGTRSRSSGTFPRSARGLGDIAEDGFVLDGELVLPGGSFETLQLRLHPAESRIRLLSQETPAQLIVFDILARAGASLLQRALADRRRELEDFMTAMPGRCAWGMQR